MATIERFLKWHFELFVKAKGQLRGDARKLSFRNSLWRPIYTINSVDKNKWSLFVSLSVCLSVSAFLPAFPFSVSLFSPPLPVCFSFHFFQLFTIYFCSFSFLSFSFPSYCLLWYKVLLFWKHSIRNNVPFCFCGCPVQRRLGKNTAWSIIASYPLGKYGTILMMIFC